MDLQDDRAFQELNIELVSLATDPLEAIESDAKELGIVTPFLSDPDATVARAYGVTQWAMPSGEPGHTSVLIDEQGRIEWVRDYGAPENGGLMYVAPDELRAALVEVIGSS